MKRPLLGAIVAAAFFAGSLLSSAPAHAADSSFSYTVGADDPMTHAWVNGIDCSEPEDWVNFSRHAVRLTVSVSESGSYTLRDTYVGIDGRIALFEGLYNPSDVSNCIIEIDDGGTVNLQAGVDYTMLGAGYGGQLGTVTFLTSGPGVFSVQQPNATTTSVTPSSASTPLGTSIDLTATISADGQTPPTPTGTVEFFAAGTPLGTASLDAVGTAALSEITLPFGTNSITATYSGDTRNEASTSATIAVEVTAAITTTTVAASATSIQTGAATDLTATVIGADPTGTVEFFAAGTSLGTATLDATGQAHLSEVAMETGTHAITANYGGDQLNLASTSANPLTISVNAVPESSPTPAPTEVPAPTPNPTSTPTPTVSPELILTPSPGPSAMSENTDELASTGAPTGPLLAFAALTVVCGLTFSRRARRARS